MSKYSQRPLDFDGLKTVPVTVHVAVGTDTTHVHPALDAAALGRATHRDFRLFCALARGLDQGGVYLNAGSAVLCEMHP